MTNFEPQSGTLGETAEHPKTDPKLIRAYRTLNEDGDAPVPSPTVHDLIRERAHRPPPGGRWIWPASLAASLALCTTLVFQLARVVQPNPPSGTARTESLLPAPAIDAGSERPAPAVGGGVDDGGVTSVVAGTNPSPALDSPEFWWEQLRLHANNADREGFLATWEVYQQHRDDTPLPDDLRRWIADNQLPLPGLSDG